MIDHADARLAETLLNDRSYVYARLDNAPLILNFEQQLAQQRAADEILRQIEAVIDFEFACLTRGVDPRTRS